MLVDSHCHLDSRNLRSGDVDDVLVRAKSAGVLGVFCVGVGATDDEAKQAVALAESHNNVKAVVGLHPHEASAHSEALLGSLRELASRQSVVAVGEIGLDYHYDFSPREQQREVFRAYLRLAKELKKPVVIHTREAAEDTLAIMREEKANEVGGVFHCYSENLAFARQALDLGFDISFSGIVTFPSAQDVQAVAKFVPGDRYYVETDSPYLAPIPKRGKTCEPAYLAYTAQKLADLRGISFEQVALETTANLRRRFRLDDWLLA